MKNLAPQKTRHYWRSLDRLLDSPAVAEAAREELAEFPDGADLPPDAMSRRTMLTVMGASFALAGLQGCRRPVENILPYVNAPETIIPGVPRYYATTMPFGTDAYGVLVESHEGRPTKIEGNESHPSSHGAAGTWTQASILGLYDPDRSAQVMQRSEGGESAEEEHGEDEHGDEAQSATHAAVTWDDFDAFWLGHAETLGDGSGLAVVSAAYSSPTLARLRAAFEARFPAARWVVHEPAGDHNVFAGAELATGGAHRPLYHVDQASTILALDADFLHSESDAVRLAREFARRRRADADGSRLYAVESTMTVTGAAADHRLRMKSGEVAGFTAALAAELGVAAPDGTAPSGSEGKLRTLAEDLRAAGSAALVIAGRRQPPEVHAMALAINQALGAVGTTVTLHQLADAGYGGPDALAALATDADSIGTLVILGGNPAYDASADVDFAGLLGKVAHSVHLSSHFDETSHLAEWHLPVAHYLEAWGDARAADGTLSVVQPLIAPLLNGRSEIEIANLLASDAFAPGYDLVRETWRGQLTGNFEKQWRRVLHDGLLEGSASPAAGAVQGDLAALTLHAAPSGTEVTFHLDSSAHDGRFANNGWLQELPDAMTKITWDNAAVMSLATAEELGLTGSDDKEKRLYVDRVALTCRGQTIEAPIFVLPGQADGSIALYLGYGRTAAGRVGDGVGFSAYALRHSEAPWTDGVSVAKAEGRHLLVQTQEHWTMADRHLVIEATREEYKDNHHFVHDEIHTPADSQLFSYHNYDEGYQWGLTIDLTSCIGCNACLVACQSENNIPVVGKEQIKRGREMHWIRIDRYFVSHSEDDSHEMTADPEVAFQPVPCMHCENAPCEQVCPVAATVHDSEGINAMVYNRCIGTRYCSNNCPYKVRRFNFFNYTKDTPELLKIAQNPDVTVRSRGVMEKCTYCLQRVSEGKIAAKREGREVRDGEVRSACQQTCPTEAITFGNIRDEASQVARNKAGDLNYTLLDELNNRPRTSFLAKLRNPNPAWKEA